MGMKASDDCRQPPLNTSNAEPFVLTRRKYFHFLDHIRAYLVCVSLFEDTRWVPFCDSPRTDFILIVNKFSTITWVSTIVFALYFVSSVLIWLFPLLVATYVTIVFVFAGFIFWSTDVFFLYVDKMAIVCNYMLTFTLSIVGTN